MMNSSELHQRRLRLGISREQLAHAVGVDSHAIAAWEEGAEAIACPRALEQVLRQREDAMRRSPDRHVA